MKHYKKHEIVIPSDYSKVFERYAKELDLDLENQEIILKELSNDCAKLDSVIKQTHNNLTSLYESATSATVAIDKQDKNSLAAIRADIEDMKEKISFLQKELFNDTLTKAYNRKWLNELYLNNDRFQSNGNLVFIDLNDFKHINDAYGHLIGDIVLRYLADFLKKELDYSEVHIVRYAGDEFLALIENDLNSAEITEKIKALQNKLSHQKLKPKSHSQDITFSFSFAYGVAQFKKNDSFLNIIELADEKMYENKKEKISLG